MGKAYPKSSLPPVLRHANLLGFGLTLILLLVGGVLGYLNAQHLAGENRSLTRTHEVIATLEALLSTLKDAETGQRGYLLTGEDRYLAPYNAAMGQVSAEISRLEELLAADSRAAKHLSPLKQTISLRLDELKQTVSLLRRGDRDGALAIVRGETGKRLMDDVRGTIAVIQEEQRGLLRRRAAESDASYRAVVLSIVLTAAVGVLLVGLVFYSSQRNLAQQRRAASDLAEEKERLRVTLASIGDGVLVTDEAGRITFLNPVAESLTGWLSADAVGAPLEEVFRIVNETTRDRVENPALRALQEKVIVGLANHTVLIARDGTERPIDDSAAPIRLDKGVVGAVLVFRDVSERRRQEQELAQAHRFLVSSLDALAAHIAVLDENGSILMVNREWREFAEANGALAQSCGVGADYLLICDESGHAGACEEGRQAAQGIRDVLGGRSQRFEMEYPCHAPDVARWFVMRVSRFEVGGAARAVVAHENISERKLAELDLRGSEQRLRLAQRAGRTGVFEWLMPEGRVVWSPELEALYGVEEGTFEGNFEDWRRRVVPEDAEGVVNGVERCLRELRVDYSYEFRAVLPDGARRWLAGQAMFQFDDQGRPLRMIGVNVDIDDRKKTEERLRQLAADLSEADRRKDEFLATLAHELRNPLAPIRNGLQILRLAGPVGSTVEQARAVMERQLAQMVRLVDDLLDVSRITRNKLELRKERVDLAAVVASAVETSRPLIETGGHRLSVNLPSAPVYVDADLTRLAQVFSNLLNNAAKYTEKGGRIWLTAEREGDEVRVAVKDSGMGIPPAMLPRVFDLFTQVDRTLERSQGGLGIGLTLVRRLTEMHGGSVEARSDGYGQGSEFIVRLPAVASPVSLVQGTDGGVARRLPARRILVVDDNQDSADSLSLLLNMLGHEVRTEYDGLSAVETARLFRPDVILLDIGLPGMNGYEVCRTLREQEDGDRPVIVACTGWGQEEDRRRSEEAGFNSHLVKPVDPTALEKLLGDLA